MTAAGDNTTFGIITNPNVPARDEGRHGFSDDD